MLTGEQIAVCRDLLAEHKAQQVESSRGTKTGRGEIKRFWGGIPAPYHAAVLEFLGNYVSANNVDVIRISDGDVPCSVPGVLGDYVFTHAIANGQPVRSNGEFFIKAVHCEPSPSAWQWAIVDSNNMILFLTDLVPGDPIWHWAEDWEEWRDEWAVNDDAALEPTAALPTIPTVWNPQTLTMTSAEDHLKVNEYGWIVTDEAATYTVTGEIVLNAVVAEDAVYGVVKAPLVDAYARSGSWTSGTVELVETAGKKSANDGRWIVVQTLWQEPREYLLVGKRVTEQTTEETRLYMGIPEGEVSELVSLLAATAGYVLVESQARQSGRREGIYDVYVTLLSVDPGASGILVGKKASSIGEEETYLYQWVKESEVSAKVEALSALGSYYVVDVDARKTKYDGVFDVYVTQVLVNTGTVSIVAGRAATRYTSEETLLYRYVKAADVPALINGASGVSGTEIRTGSRLAKTKYEGVYDVYVTTLSLLAGDPELVGGSSVGFYKSRKVYVIRHIADGAVAAIVSGYLAQDGVENVRAAGSGQEGVSHIYYTLVELPDAYTENEVSFEMSEGGWKPTDYTYRLVYYPYIKNNDGETDYQLGTKIFPASHDRASKVRKVTVSRLRTYSWSAAGSLAGSASAVGHDFSASFTLNGIRRVRLPTGVWVHDAVQTVKSVWGATA
jgi:hypothetical protein